MFVIVQCLAQGVTSLPTYICSHGTKLNFSFFSHVFTELSRIEGMLRPISYDSDSPNSLMFKNSPPAQGCSPSSCLRVSSIFLYQSTFPKLSCNWDKLGLLSPVSPVGMASLQERGAHILFSLMPVSLAEAVLLLLLVTR